MIKKLLVANRGEIARRIFRTARRMGIATVAVASEADRRALHTRDADVVAMIGASPASESYLVIEKIIAAAKATGADAIHPGYGFLSENADFSQACRDAGLTFVGPRAEAMRALGGKAAAKDIAIKAGVPVVPGYQGQAQDLATLTREAARIGFPIMIKAVAGGGGRGMRFVPNATALPDLLDSARREAMSAFGNPSVLIEKIVRSPRHIEVQVFGDAHGNVVHLFERDCTLQRRNQKVVEEAPAPDMSEGLRQRICAAAVKLAASVRYEGAGTVEFLVEGDVSSEAAAWYFIEMNTRLQVEHPVTEAITGLDLVEWQLRIAAGERLPLPQSAIATSGHAIEARLCAEDPAQGFMPSVGPIDVFDADGLRDVRLETGVAAGSTVSPFYDSMIAKLIVHRPTRAAALDDLAEALATLHVGGVATNARFLINLLAHPAVVSGAMDTGLIGRDLAALSDQRVSGPVIAAAAGERFGREARRWSEAASQSGPWAATDGFALGGSPVRRTRYAVDGALVAFDVDWASIDPVSLAPTVRIVDAAFEGAPARTFDVRHQDERTYAFERGRQIRLEPPTYDVSNTDDAGDGTTVRAPINGRVAKTFVAAGDHVAKGARIAVVEAMKMEHVLVAGVAGTVERLAAAEGAQVTQGAIVAILTPA
jgi:3-methylcrotonyl-CoA carboxylase alpha subunit